MSAGVEKFKAAMIEKDKSKGYNPKLRANQLIQQIGQQGHTFRMSRVEKQLLATDMLRITIDREKTFEFTNDTKGYRELVDWLKQNFIAPPQMFLKAPYGARSYEEFKELLAEKARAQLNKKYKNICEFDIVIAPMAYQANPVSIMTHFKVEKAPGLPKKTFACQIVLPEEDLLLAQQLRDASLQHTNTMQQESIEQQYNELTR